jgi:hypothetical protein
MQSVSVDGGVLAAGSRLEFVSKKDSEVHVRWGGGEYAVPIVATDLNAR